MIIFLFALLTAFIPVFFWYIILTRSQRKGMQFFFWTVFCIAMIFAYVWKTYAEFFLINYLHGFIGLFFIFLIVGGLIEYSKNIIVRFIGHNFFKTLDDVVDLSFATALGFTAMENILVFYDLFSLSFSFNSPIYILKEVLAREFFILPIHLFCSGIFGYYYGLSLFALPEERKRWGKIYPSLQILKGTIISVLVYGLFFFIMEQDFRVGDIAIFFGYENFPLNEGLFPFIAFFFSTIGGLFFFQLMEHHEFITETKKEKEVRIAKEKEESQK